MHSWRFLCVSIDPSRGRRKACRLSVASLLVIYILLSAYFCRYTETRWITFSYFVYKKNSRQQWTVTGSLELIAWSYRKWWPTLRGEGSVQAITRRAERGADETLHNRVRDWIFTSAEHAAHISRSVLRERWRVSSCLSCYYRQSSSGSGEVTSK